jgi:hypothetical protein
VLAATFDAPTLITTGLIIVLAMVLGYRLLNRDPSVRRTRWGIFMERDHYDEEGEVWTVDPLDPESETRPVPPPTPPPPLPRPPDDELDTRITWPEREDET